MFGRSLIPARALVTSASRYQRAAATAANVSPQGPGERTGHRARNSDGYAVALAAAGLFASASSHVSSSDCEVTPACTEEDVELMNWSGTHKVTTQMLYTPESQKELRDVVAWAHRGGQKIRPIGTGLSPNGLALNGTGMLSMAQLDSIIEVDKQNMTITTEGGCRVSTMLEELRKHGMTLSNFSSITEQQIAGWTQVGAHGTGARIPTVDEMITQMTLVTPGKGEMILKADGPSADLFRLGRVALGSLGIVSQVTLKCVPSYTLHERMYTTSVAELRKNHSQLLKTYRHVRYMWIPYTDVVVVVVSDVAKPGAKAKAGRPEAECIKPLQEMIRKLQPDCGTLEGANFAQLREKLLQINPLDADHVATVNRAEAEFWGLSSGERIGDSTDILGFECGGSQWVLENCIPCGSIKAPSHADIDYMVEIKKTIERERIAAASPIEQRWTSSSSSPLSPAYSPNKDDIFTWVGVIMYITGEETEEEVRQKFKEYAKLHADQTFRYGGCFHWGKIDLAFHEGAERLQALRQQMKKRFDVDSFLAARKQLDPKGILSNKLVETTFGTSR